MARAKVILVDADVIGRWGHQNRKIYQESSIYESFKIFRWCYKALQRRFACKAILTIM